MNNCNEYITTQGELIHALRELTDQHIKRVISDDLYEMEVGVYLNLYRDMVFSNTVDEREIVLRLVVYKRLGKKRMNHINIVVKKKLGFHRVEKEYLKYRKNFSISGNE